MMMTRTIVISVLLCLSIAAAADFKTITEAYEVKLSTIRMPATDNGTMTFRQCHDCDWQTLRVNSNTRYAVNNHDLTLAKFTEQLKHVRNRKEETVVVLHHLETDTIVAVKVRL